MQRQRKFNKPGGPLSPNPNMIVPIGKPQPPSFLCGVEVTEDNARELYLAHQQGEQAGYRYAAIQREALEVERRKRLAAWLTSGRTLADWYITAP